MNGTKGFLSPNELADILGGITVQGVYKAIKACGAETIQITPRNKVITPEGVRKLLESRGFIYPKSNISFQIVKGGVGKTSLSHLLSVRACHYGARVLVIDADQQSNLTMSLNVQARELPVLLNLVRDNTPVQESIVKVSDGLHLIPSNLNNSRLDVELTQSADNLRDLIKDLLDPVRDAYDIVIVDCPPAINKINTAVTCASDLVIIPINPDPYAMEGLAFSLSELDRVKKQFKASFDTKIVWNKYDARERLGTYYLHELAKDPNSVEKVLPVVIRVDVTTKNSIFDATSVFERAKKSSIREDSDQFTREILGINQWVHEARHHKHATNRATHNNELQSVI